MGKRCLHVQTDIRGQLNCLQAGEFFAGNQTGKRMVNPKRMGRLPSYDTTGDTHSLAVCILPISTLFVTQLFLNFKNFY